MYQSMLFEGHTSMFKDIFFYSHQNVTLCFFVYSFHYKLETKYVSLSLFSSVYGILVVTFFFHCKNPELNPYLLAKINVTDVFCCAFAHNSESIKKYRCLLVSVQGSVYRSA